MIKSKSDLNYYIQQDIIMNSRDLSFKTRLKNLVFPDLIMDYLIMLRKAEYYSNCFKSSLFRRCWGKLFGFYYKYKLRNLGIKLGYSIPLNVFGAGLSLPHFGTIVVNSNARVGENCRLHVGVNIGASGGNPQAPIIGNNVYIGPGAILFGNIKIADNITIGANATVNKTFEKQHVVLAGSPASIVKEGYPCWVDFNGVKKHIN